VGRRGEPAERARRRAARPVERDLEVVLADLADDFLLLASLVEQRATGQRRLAVAGQRPPAAEAIAPHLAMHQPAAFTSPPPPPVAERESSEPAAAAPPSTPRAPAVGHVAQGARQRQPARYGLNIAFEARLDDPELGRLVESTVWVNEAHPAYRRAAASRSEGYHVALAVALALAPLAVEPAAEHGFVTAFLGRWGDVANGRYARRSTATALAPAGR